MRTYESFVWSPPIKVNLIKKQIWRFKESKQRKNIDRCKQHFIGQWTTIEHKLRHKEESVVQFVLIKDGMYSCPTPSIPASWAMNLQRVSWTPGGARKDGRGYSTSAGDGRAPSRSEGQAPAAVVLQFRPSLRHIGGRFLAGTVHESIGLISGIRSWSRRTPRDVERWNFGRVVCPPGRTMNLGRWLERQTTDAIWIVGCDLFY
jgi:hypothetical protein